MIAPAEYVEVIDRFLEMGAKAVKFEKASREDFAALSMVIYLRELPIRIKLTKGVIYLYLPPTEEP